MNIDERLLPYKEHIHEIKEALLNKNAYLFIGAGFSKNAIAKTIAVTSEFKTWTDFMEQLAQKLWPGLDKEGLERKVAGNHLYIAQLYEEEFGVSGFYKELLKAVPYKDYLPSAIHQKLIGMDGWKGFITTNQDTLIEQTLDRLHVYYDEVISDLDIATKPAETKVFKLHGSMERPESIIFSEEQYRTYEQNHPLLHVKVKSIFAEHCVVFVGFSLTDVNFKEIYGWVKDVLQSDYQRKAYAFVFEQEIDPYIKRYWEKRNIILLPIFTKGNTSTGNVFQQGLQMYIDEFNNDLNDTVVNKEILDSYTLLEQEDWNDKTMKKLLYILKNVPSGNNPFFEDKFISFLSENGERLSEQTLFLLLESIYEKKLIHPFRILKGKRLIDYLIEGLEKDGNLKLYNVLLEKAEILLRLGDHDAAEQFIKTVLADYIKLPVEIRNSILYLNIIIEKYRMNFEQIYYLVNQIGIDWEQPIWLNRIASTYLTLGDQSRALNLYNMAIKVADAKKDEWNLYLAYLAKLNIMDDFLNRESFQEDERKEVRKSVYRLSEHLKETNHPTFERWREFNDLKSNWWIEYRKWKSELGKNQTGFNTAKGSSKYNVFEMIYFHEWHGFPHTALNDKNFDVVLDVFIENKEIVKGTLLAILFGHDKQIKHAFRFEKLTDISNDERTQLYQQANQMTKSIIWYIHTLRNDGYIHFAELWTTAISQYWNQFIPILHDEEIDAIAHDAIELFEKLQDFPQVYSFVNAREKLILLMGKCLFYRQQSIDKTKVLDLLKKCMTDFRLVNAFLMIRWDDFGDVIISNEIVESLTSKMDSSSVKLIYEWLDNKLLSDEQKQFVFQKVFEEYGENSEDDSLLRARLSYMRFFKKQLDANVIFETIENTIHRFQSSFSSTNQNELYHFAENVEFLDEKQINRILDASQKKISTNSSEENWLNVEINGLYIYFTFKLMKAGKIQENQLREELKKVDHLELNMANSISELAKDEKFTEIIFEKLLDLSYAYQVHTRKNAFLLIGFWLKERIDIEKKEIILLQRLLVGIDDSNVEIASEAIRGVAFILMHNSTIIPNDFLENIIFITEKGRNRNEIGYLTNLAFLYCELSKINEVSHSKKEIIREVFSQLSQSNYSNVRRECESK